MYKQRTMPRITGVYTILCVANQKRYIGSSSNLHPRLYGHKSRLKHNKHHSKEMQNDWNYFGAAKFEFSIINRTESLTDAKEIEYKLIRENHSINSVYNKVIPCIALPTIFMNVGIDPETYMLLKIAAKKSRLSINKTALELLRQSLYPLQS
jgi:group I intron endonuclease